MLRAILLTALGTGCLLAQTPTAAKFEVASVRPSQPSADNTIGVHLDGAQVRMISVPMRDYIAIAYRVKPDQVTGQDWIATEKFDVIAKLPEGAKSDQMPEMLQSLLAERFQLKLHRDRKEFPIYALILGKPPLKLQESAPDAAGDAAPKGAVNVVGAGTAAGVSVDLGNGSSYTFVDGKFEIKKVNMEMLARQLERYVDRPIIDMTGLKGTYDLTVTVTPEDARTMMIHAAMNSGIVLSPRALQAAENGSIASLLDGLQQLGLKMDARKAPLDILVVDQELKTPTEN